MDPEFKLPVGRRELKIGESLTSNGTSFHGIKYDFKPSNEEFNSATMEITPTNQVTLKYPQTSNEGSSDFMYSGTMKQFPKEYFLVIDHVTGDITLEKLTANIQLKRSKVVNPTNKPKYQNNKKPGLGKESSSSPEICVNDKPSTSKKKAKRKQKTKECTNNNSKLVSKKYGMIPAHSPLHPSPSRNSPNESKNQSSNSDYKFVGLTHSPEASSSQRMCVDDDESSMTGFESKFPINLPELTNLPQEVNEFGLPIQGTIGTISESSSDSSSDSDSNSESSSSSSSGAPKKVSQTRVNGYPNGSVSPTLMQGQLLKEDLQLSESGSDSD